MATIQSVSSQGEIEKLSASNDRKLVVVYFEASFATECASMTPILEQYGKDVDFVNVVIAKVDAEKNEDIASKFGVEMVPSFVFMKNGKVLEKLSGFNPPELNRLIKKCLDTTSLPETSPVTSVPENGAGNLETRLKKLINLAKVMVFMKGAPDAPRCGFSRQLMEIFRENQIEFQHFDILTDETVRQGLKEFSKWPTYPQIYVSGELVGGLDIIKELKATDELKSTLNP